jgi:alkanesulfonate monooxygenase SsuD/methylene tetrahydromethanopterin reductase-like flavin-dependent oxidoreductase (luciferase family)
MRFGTIFELQPGPQPHGPDRVRQVWHDALEQAVLAEELGFDYVWSVEHHFLGDYSSSSAPEVFLAWVAANTKRIRIAQGVALALKDVNHAWRLAERGAALDIISGGRYDFGAGRSITKQELIGFGVEPAESRAMQLETLDVLPRMWTEDTFSWDGEYYKLPERRLAVRPVQEPHPPMWLACSQPDSWRIAGERGLGVLSFGVGDPTLLAEAKANYEAGLAQATPAGGMINRNMAAAPLFYCAPTDQEALRVATPNVEFFVGNTMNFVRQWADEPAVEYKFYKELLAKGNGQTLVPGTAAAAPVEIEGLTEDEAAIGGLVESGRFVIGSPETCRRVIQKYVDAGFDQVIFCGQFGSLTNEQIQASLRLFAKEVMPHFTDVRTSVSAG